MTNPELEEKLREAACFGDIDGVKELISKYEITGYNLYSTCSHVSCFQGCECELPA